MSTSITTALSKLSSAAPSSPPQQTSASAAASITASSGATQRTSPRQPPSASSRPATSGFRAATVFDPLLICAQIVAMQCSYYLILSTIVSVFDVVTGVSATLDHILGFAAADPFTVLGWTLFLAVVATAAAMCFISVIIVERSRLCLDFACTLHGFHVLFVTVHSGRIPNTFFWWFQTTVSATILAMGSEYLCMQRELTPIVVGNLNRSTSSDTTDNLAQNPRSGLSRKLSLGVSEMIRGVLSLMGQKQRKSTSTSVLPTIRPDASLDSLEMQSLYRNQEG